MSMFKKNTKFSILTPTGFQDFKGIQTSHKSSTVDITLDNGMSLICSKNHVILTTDGELKAKDIKKGYKVHTSIGTSSVRKIQNSEGRLLFDPVEVEGGNTYFSNGILSHNCSFLGTGDTYIDGEILSQLNEQVDGDYWRRYNNRMRVWKEAHPAYEYLIAADISLGREKDYSAFHIINTYNGEQVAEFYSNRTPINELASILASVGREYNQAIIIPERNSIGFHLIDTLKSLEYENLWEDEKGEVGFQMTATNKEQILSLMEEFVRTRRFKLNSTRVVRELLTFIVKDNGKAEADEGCHDDLVISLAIASYALKQIIHTTPVEYQMGDHNEISPDIFSKTTATLPSHGGMVEEDIRWLLS